MKHVKFIRLRWLGYIERMKERKLPKHLLHEHIIGVKKEGNPMKR